MFLHYCIKMRFIWAGKTSLTLKIIQIFDMANNGRQDFLSKVLPYEEIPKNGLLITDEGHTVTI